MNIQCRSVEEALSISKWNSDNIVLTYFLRFILALKENVVLNISSNFQEVLGLNFAWKLVT